MTLFNDRIRIDLKKRTKLMFYTTHLFHYYSPRYFYQKNLDSMLNYSKDTTYIENRVNYYNKIDNHFQANSKMVTIKEFKKEKMKTYFFDLYKYLKYNDHNLKISYLFGDIITIPKSPHLLKSRPIDGDNQNSVLMKLNQVRHFNFVKDKTPFENKKNLLVWRGKAHMPHRKKFLDRFFEHPLCDLGQTGTNKHTKLKYKKPKMTIEKQLQYKFILSIEGNDVATNLKWIMSSNSLAFMKKPKYETWFMEGTLIPNHHYVLLKDDYSDLEEKILYYSKNIEKSLEIIKNANNYVKQFQNQKREDIIPLLVLQKYFQKSGQLN